MWLTEQSPCSAPSNEYTLWRMRETYTACHQHPKTVNSCREIPMSKELLAMVKPMKKVVNGDFYVLTNEDKPTEPRTYRNYYNSSWRT